VRIQTPQVIKGGKGEVGTSAISDRKCVSLGSLTMKGPYITIPQYRFNKTKQHTPRRSRYFHIPTFHFFGFCFNRVILTFVLNGHLHTCSKALFVILFRMRTDSDCLFFLVCVRVCVSVFLSVCLCVCAAHCIKRERIKKEIDQIVKSGEFFSNFQYSQQVNASVSHSGPLPHTHSHFINIFFRGRIRCHVG